VPLHIKIYKIREYTESYKIKIETRNVREMFLGTYLTEYIHTSHTYDGRNSSPIKKMMTHASTQNLGEKLVGLSEFRALVSNEKFR
jgi:hypothetical protein